MAVISLLSDFGDLYPAQMKAVILRINPAAVLVDITHQVPAQDIRAGAFALMISAPYFPEGTVHLAVVDPGVGTSRRSIAVQAGLSFFVGPDNGLLIPAACRSGQELTVREITNQDLLPEPSSTFHGRDIFAPVAARLSSGMAVEMVGDEIRNFVEIDFGAPEVIDRGVRGQVVYVDGFGNAITNIPGKVMFEWFTYGDMLDMCGVNIPFVKTYGSVKKSMPLLVIGSHGYLEISVNSGNAAKLLDLGTESRVDIVPL